MSSKSIHLLEVQHQALLRYVSALPDELAAWVKYVQRDNILQKNFNQITVLKEFLTAIYEESCSRLDALDPGQDSFLDDVENLSNGIINTQRIWTFFRDRLETRFIPYYRAPLLMVDLITHDCYQHITNQARIMELIREDSFREYPLAGLRAVRSPVTWQRHVRPRVLQNHQLPLPIIDLPWAHIVNPWDLLTIAHEVGHDIDYDLGELTPHLKKHIRQGLVAESATEEHLMNWVNWTCEILADVIGVYLGGSAFVWMSASILTLPRSQVTQFDPNDSHPPHFLRMFINCALLRRLGLADEAQKIEGQWTALYGKPDDLFVPYMAQIDPVLEALLTSPLAPLTDISGQSHSLQDLLRFSTGDQDIIRDTADKLCEGQTIIWNMPIRYLISAATMAAQSLIREGRPHQLAVLADHTLQTVIKKAKPGQLSALASPHTRQRLQALARSTLDAPLGEDDVANDRGAIP